MSTPQQPVLVNPKRSRLQTVARRVLLGIAWLNGITAPICGILMIVSPDGEIMMMQALIVEMQSWPGASIFFQDLTWSGIALLLVNGVSNLVCLALWLAKKQVYTTIGIICGILLILWCIWETIFIPNAVTAVYLCMGIVQTVAAAYCTYSRKLQV